MAKYRKKPIVVEAVLFDGKNAVEGLEVIEDTFVSPGWGICANCGKSYVGHGIINTLEGKMFACPGDYIIKGVNGEFYPCKPDIFEKTYEVVKDETV